MFRRSALLIVLLGGVVAAPSPAQAQCGVERWPVKTATDPDASLVSASVIQTTLAHLRALPVVRPLPQERRLAPVETTIYSVTATLVEYRRTADSDYQLVLADEEGRTILVELPAPTCSMGSRFEPEISHVRSIFENRFFATEAFKSALVPVEVRGIGFFDFVAGERGAAPNGIQLHPVTYLTFHPLIAPRSPFTSRKRAVRKVGDPPCPKPSLTLTSSKALTCSGESVVLSWQASDSKASVTIDGIGTLMPSAGTTPVRLTANTAYSGRATNACGSGPEAVAIVSLQSSSTASISGPSSMQPGTSATISVATSGTTSWTLSSALRNSMTPSAGTGSGSFSSTYRATSSGTDTVTLTTSGGCGSVVRTLIIVIAAPQNQGLLCCDGTRSPTCFICSSKQGCCSGHRGVCGCP